MIYSCFHCDRMAPRLHAEHVTRFTCAEVHPKAPMTQNGTRRLVFGHPVHFLGELPLHLGRGEAGDGLEELKGWQLAQVVLVPPGQRDVLKSTRFSAQKLETRFRCTFS